MTSVKSYSGLDPERCESKFTLPSDIVMMLDEVALTPDIEGLVPSPSYITNLMTSRRE